MKGPSISKPEFLLLREYIERECGIQVNEEKAYLIETRLAELVSETKCRTFGEFYQLLKISRDTQLKNRIIDAITTGETQWFRDNSPFIIFKEHFLPKYFTEIWNGKRSSINVWSAACSTGQEPYSLAITFLENIHHMRKSKSLVINPKKLKILATDISFTSLKTAMTGEYDTYSMERGMKKDIRDKYFQCIGGGKCQVTPDVKEVVTFRQFNLLHDSYLHLGTFDLVLCRNVAIYFSRESKEELFTKISRTLSPDGVLIIGASELLSDNLLSIYEPVSFRGGYYYKLRRVK